LRRSQIASPTTIASARVAASAKSTGCKLDKFCHAHCDRSDHSTGETNQKPGPPREERAASTSGRCGLAPSSPRYFHVLVEQCCGGHPRLSQFEEPFALLFGARHACRGKAFVSDLTVFVGPGHGGGPKRRPPFDPRRRATPYQCMSFELKFCVRRRSAGTGLSASFASICGDFRSSFRFLWTPCD